MDASVSRLIEEVATEYGVDSGFLIRVHEEELKVAHLARRHGIYVQLKELARKSARRHLQSEAPE